MTDKRRRVGRVVDDVDLLLVQLVHDRAYPLSHRPDAGALRADIWVVADDRDLAAMTGLARHRLDLHRPVGDLRNFELEQLLDQSRMSPRNDDLRAPQFLAN